MARNQNAFRMAAVLAGLTLVPPVSGAQIPETVDADSIPNYRRITPALAAAGQPSAEALRQLKAQGFRTVINLRTDAEPVLAQEEALVREQGLAYVRVPLTPASLDAEDVAAVAKVLDDPESAPVLIHCTTSNRVGGMWAAIQARRGKTLEQALEEGRKAGLTSEAMTEAVRRVVGTPKP